MAQFFIGQLVKFEQKKIGNLGPRLGVITDVYRVGRKVFYEIDDRYKVDYSAVSLPTRMESDHYLRLNKRARLKIF